MLSREVNKRLTRIGPDIPAGKITAPVLAPCLPGKRAH
jgi:hypothetical protein